MPAKAKKWCFPRPCEDIKDLITRELNVSPALAAVLVNRGIDNLYDASAFLNPSMEYLCDPFTMKDMDDAVNKIKASLKNEEKIMIYGDYDADGFTGAAILTSALKRMGGKVSYFLPSRFTEGYGLQKSALQKFAEEGYRLIITVDCGINAFAEAAYCKQLGMELIITDHHVSTAPLGEDKEYEAAFKDIPVINPMQKDCSYPFKVLSGAGVAYKLLCALLKRTDSDIDPADYLDLVALGTIADIVPLMGENRILTHFGLQKLNSKPSIGLKELIKSSFPGALNISSVTANGVIDGESNLSSRDVAYKIAPYINAAGRLGEAYPAAELLMCEDSGEAKRLTAFLIDNNNMRRDIENALFEEARQMIDNYYNSEPDTIIVLGKEGWHNGVIGIVASKLMRIYDLPVALIAIEEGTGKGSARSVHGFNITEALGKCSGLLKRFGGHHQAAGFSLDKKNINDLRGALEQAWKERSHPEDTLPCINVDSDLAPHEITIDLAEQLEVLEPHGAGNPPPIFSIRGWKLDESRLVGRDKSHLKLRFFKRERVISAIYFGVPDDAKSFKSGALMDLVVFLKKGTWQDRPVLNIEVQDMAPENKNKPLAVYGSHGNTEKKAEAARPSQVRESAEHPLTIFDHRNKGTLQEAAPGGNNNNYYSRIQQNKLTILKGICNNNAETLIYIGSDNEKNMLIEKLPSTENIKFLHPRNINGAGKEGGENKVTAGIADSAVKQLVFYHLPVLPMFLKGALSISGLKDAGNLTVHLLYNYEDRLFNQKIMAAATPTMDEAEELYRRAGETLSGDKGGGEDRLFCGMAQIKRNRLIQIFKEAKIAQWAGNELELSENRPQFSVNLLKGTETYKKLWETEKESRKFQEFMLSATATELTEYMGNGMNLT